MAGQALTQKASSRPRADEAARAAGIGRRKVTLHEVDKRRTQLWAISIFFIAAVTVAIALYAIGADFMPVSLNFQNLTTWAVLVLVGGLALAFLVYVIEKEINLRRLTTLLIEERVLSSALSNRLAEISALSEVGKAINATLELKDVLHMILSSALELLGGTEGSIMLLDETDETLEVVTSFKGPDLEQIEQPRRKLGEGIAGRVAKAQAPLLIQQDDPLLTLEGHPNRGIFSAMSVPLMRRDELVGVLNINETKGERTFSEQDLNALRFFAEHAAIAIGNARIFEQERDTIGRLEELDRLKSDFVATVSHELKTPLTAIIGSAQTLARRRARMNEEQQDNLAVTIERQGKRLLRLVEDVLTTARIESRLPRLRRELVDLREIAEFVVEDLKHNEVSRGKEMIVEANPKRPTVWADMGALQQILSNLVENALKYSPADTRVKVIVQERSTEATLQVIDEGYGMTPEQIQTIFDRFQQIDSSSTRDSGGFGLGLYIVKSLVEAQNGSVDVQSSPGVGSTFTITLPMRTARSEGEGHVPQEAAGHLA